MKLRIAIILILCAGIAIAANPVKEEVFRLFTQASSGEIRYQSLVQPSKDSLIAMGDSAAKYLALKLNSTDARERHTLVDIYRGIGKAATPYLLKALDTKNKDQLRTTSWALGEVHDSTAVDALARVAKHEDFTVRAQAIESIGKSGGGLRSAKLVTPYLQDPVFSPRKSAAAALGRLMQPESIKDLINALADEHFSVRLVAYQWLIKYDSLAYDAIVEQISVAPDERTRMLAVRLAGDLRIQKAKKLIEPMLAYDDANTRGWAIWSLARINGKEELPALNSLLETEADLFVRSQILESIDYLDTLSTN